MIRNSAWLVVRYLLLACLILVSWLAHTAQADTLINIMPGTRVIDLSMHGATVDSERRKIAIEFPKANSAEKSIIDLEAKGPGPRFTWTVYGFRNDSDKERALVLAIEPRRLTASGFLPIKPFGKRTVSLSTSDATSQLVSKFVDTRDVYSFSLAPGAEIAIAVESAIPLSGISLYDEAAFDRRETSFAFLRGAVLTVTLVISIFVVGLYSIRSHRAFVVGSFLAFVCLQFMALESGYLDRFGQGFFGLSFGLQQLRAWSECLLALALSLATWALTAPHAREPRSLLWLPAMLVAFAGLSVLGWYRPPDAAAVARGVIVLAACSGFALTLRAKLRDAGAMELGMSFWSSVVLWVFFAAVAALLPFEAPVMHAGIVSGLATVVALLAFALARLAWSLGYQSNPYLTMAASRSLALAGGRHSMWDWRAADGRLLLGKELAESLGHDPARLSGPDASRMFAALVHPADLLAYHRCLAIHALSTGDVVDMQLRLQAANGAYRWFALRATAVAGASKWPERAIGTLTDITAEREKEDRLITESLRDPVTGLASRAIFNDRLERELSKPLGLPVKVLLVALSRFKTLNDGLGHDLGDKMLIAAGERIAECLGPDDTLARLSGSMFAVMYVDALDRPGADKLAEQIIKRLADPLEMAGQDISLTACVGISGSGQAGTTAQQLHDQASRALQAAQALGLSHYLAFEESMQDDRAKTVAIESDLRRALAKGEIEVHYQPILHLATRTIVGFEALARWRHGENDYLPPADFIAIAEQAGLVGEIGDSVMAEAARQLGIWQRTLARNEALFVAVNVSGEQLSNTSLYDRIAAVIEREGLAPNSLKIEITESAAMRYPERVRQLIEKLKARGVSVSCDDFGTGFSHLASLRDLQFDTLKMDRSFIADGGIEGRGGIILSSVISLAHQLGMQVVAEGVEDEQQALLLEAIGVDMGQGYWLGAPKHARDVPGLLAVFPVVEALPPLPLEKAAAVPAPGHAPMAPRPKAAEPASHAEGTSPEAVADGAKDGEDEVETVPSPEKQILADQPTQLKPRSRSSKRSTKRPRRKSKSARGSKRSTAT